MGRPRALNYIKLNYGKFSGALVKMSILKDEFQNVKEDKSANLSYALGINAFFFLSINKNHLKIF